MRNLKEEKKKKDLIFQKEKWVQCLRSLGGIIVSNKNIMQKQDIIIYQEENWKVSVDILVENETFWMTQNQICELFWKSKWTISEHIKKIYNEWELEKKWTVRKYQTVQKEWNRDVKRELDYYNLDLILAVWYRVRSKQWVLFRKWASEKLKEYLVNWFAINDEKIKSWKTTQYFDKLQEKLREIRLSEKVFYQKIKDIYTTSIDYDPKDNKTINFFKTVQNKLLWAISQKTAAELVYNRIDIEKPLLWMSSFSKKWENQITKKDVIIAKNYLNENEMKTLSLLVEQFLAFAESMAEAQIPMKMDDWIERLDLILKMNWKEILENYWKISHKLAEDKANIIYKEFKEKRKKIEKEESFKLLERDIKNINK